MRCISIRCIRELSETGMEDPKRTPWQCTASVCVAGVHCWEISLGLEVSRSMAREEGDTLSFLSIYPGISPSMLFVSFRIKDICVLVVLV